MIPSIFLSHNWQDKHFARKLASDLMQFGVYVWIDEAEIQVGDSLIEKIRRGIDVVDYLGVILSPDSVKSEWVKREVDIAMNQEIKSKRIKVLPVMYRACELPWFLEGKLYVDFTDPKDYATSLAKLLSRLGIKDPGFGKQNSIFQRVESLVYPLTKEVNEFLLNHPAETNYIWNDDGPQPNENLVKTFQKLKAQYSFAKVQVLESLPLAQEQLSIFTECAQFHIEIMDTRKRKMHLASLLETEANGRYRTIWYDEMREHSKHLLSLHDKYFELSKRLKMSLTGELLWCTEAIFEIEARLDSLYLRAYRIDEFDKAIVY